VLTAEGSLTSRKVLQLVPERVGGWCWDDIVRQCIPDLSSGNWKSSVGNAKKNRYIQQRIYSGDCNFFKYFCAAVVEMPFVLLC